ncbi:MAG: hypothetical protein JSW07_00995, partial [bacterium]
RTEIWRPFRNIHWYVLLFFFSFLIIFCEKKSSTLEPDEQVIGSWEITYGDSLNDAAYSIKQTADRGYIAVGKTNSYVYIDEMFQIEFSGMLILKLDEHGEIVWNKIISSGIARSVDQTLDGGYIVA